MTPTPTTPAPTPAATNTDPAGLRGIAARPVLARLSALLVAVLVAATAAGSAAPNQLADRAAGFDTAYASFQGWFVGERDEQGTSYAHWRYQPQTGPPRRIDSETDYARMGRGRGIALLRRDRGARPGFSLDYLHQPGSPLDLVLLGDRYRQPGPGWAGEPTAWMARPTTLDDVGGWSPCSTAGTAPFCHLDAAVADTRAAVPTVPRTVSYGPDGTVTAQTGIRLIDLIARDLTPLTAQQLTALQPVLTTLLPFTIVIGPDGTLRHAEVNARISTASATVEIQLGFEHRGPATAADFPTPPPVDSPEVRQVDRLEYLFFLQAATDYAVAQQAAEAPH